MSVYQVESKDLVDVVVRKYLPLVNTPIISTHLASHVDKSYTYKKYNILVEQQATENNC